MIPTLFSSPILLFGRHIVAPFFSKIINLHAACEAGVVEDDILEKFNGSELETLENGLPQNGQLGAASVRVDTQTTDARTVEDESKTPETEEYPNGQSVPSSDAETIESSDKMDKEEQECVQLDTAQRPPTALVKAKNVDPADCHWPLLLRYPITAIGISIGLSAHSVLWRTLSNAPSVDFASIPPEVNPSNSMTLLETL